MTGSGVPMLPSASDSHNNFDAVAQSIYQKSLGVPWIPHETIGGDQISQKPEKFNYYVSGDISKDSNEFCNGNYVMSKSLESKVIYKVSSVQPRLNRLADDPFEKILVIPDDSFKFADNLKLDKDLHVVLLLFMVLFIILILVIYFWKTKEAIKSDWKFNDRVRPALSPKKKKIRKAVNMKSSAVTSTYNNKVASRNDNATTNEHSSIQNCDTNLKNLSRCNDTNEGRWVGNLFVSNTEIGRGSNRIVVFEGIYDGRAVAVKRLLHAHHDIALKEINNLIASDRHHNIVRWYGVEQYMDFVYISLERCIFSLSDLIQLDTNYRIPTKTDDYMTLQRSTRSSCII